MSQWIPNGKKLLSKSISRTCFFCFDVISLSSYITEADLPTGLEQKNVIIQRDRYGYGLTVSGDNPVYVLSVREAGAAQRAGININDQIIKVKASSFILR